MYVITVSRFTTLLHGLLRCVNNGQLRWALLCDHDEKCGAQNGAEREMEKTL